MDKRMADRPENMTTYVFICSLVASFGGLIFGYDIGISGGVTSMDSFLEEFFPSVYHKHLQSEEDTNQYCMFNSELLTIFTSSLYLAALVASVFASTVTRKFGRRLSMLFGGTIFFIGAILSANAQNMTMLIFGRLLLGVGIGFINQSVPMYLSEMAPTSMRGMLNLIFQLMITVGILIANFVNFLSARIKDGSGWRIALGGAAVPALFMAVGSVFLPETPTSLIEQGKLDRAYDMLQKVRSTDNVVDEYDQLMAASEESKKVEHPWHNMLERKNRPQLVMSIMIPIFQQLTGINVFMFYSPVLFKTMGFGAEAALYSAVITGGVNFLTTTVAIVLVDKVGRRNLFLEGGIQMIISQVMIGVLIGNKFGLSGTGAIPKGYGETIVAFICIYVSAFALSWGPLTWLVPSEIFPLEMRSVGQSMSVSANMFFTFLVAQVFLNMLCHMKFFLFFFFAAWGLVMTVFVYCLVPETKNVPIDEMVMVWKRHPFWGRFISDDDIPEGIKVVAQRHQLII